MFSSVTWGVVSSHLVLLGLIFLVELQFELLPRVGVVRVGETQGEDGAGQQ